MRKERIFNNEMINKAFRLKNNSEKGENCKREKGYRSMYSKERSSVTINEKSGRSCIR